jgi:SAM-dependent methyltransferase
LHHTVSSGCIVVPRPAHVVQCQSCGLVQKRDSEIVAEYDNYVIFDNSPVGDKIVRRPGHPDRTRSQIVADLVIERLGNRKNARVLEVGCHRGAFLQTLKNAAPSFDLYGFDVTSAHTPKIEEICGKGHYHHGDLSTMKGPFDACILIHTFEHIPDPVGALKTLAALSKPNGVVIIVVPDCRLTPSDFYTIDHTGHYDDAMFANTAARAGLQTDVLPDFIPHELTAVCSRKSSSASLPQPNRSTRWDDEIAVLERFERGLAFLPIGPCLVLGTAHIGVLLAGALKDRCIGFVDEADYRIGKTFLGRPVRHPRDAAGQTVVLGVAPLIAEKIQPRLQTFGCTVIDPWRIAPPSHDAARRRAG